MHRFVNLKQNQFQIGHLQIFGLAKCNKQTKATDKLVGFGIANSAIPVEAAEQAAKMAWAIAELANALQNNQNEQLKEMMKLFKDIIAELNDNKPACGNNHSNPKQTYSQCPHCKLHHLNHNKC